MVSLQGCGPYTRGCGLSARGRGPSTRGHGTGLLCVHVRVGEGGGVRVRECGGGWGRKGSSGA